MKSCTQAVNCGVVKSTSIPLHNMWDSTVFNRT
jgi:hypothetical protein